MTAPPQKPCTTRKATSEAKLLLKAQPTLAAVKPTAALTNMPRKVMRRVSHPVSGIAMTSAIR